MHFIRLVDSRESGLRLFAPRNALTDGLALPPPGEHSRHSVAMDESLSSSMRDVPAGEPPAETGKAQGRDSCQRPVQ